VADYISRTLTADKGTPNERIIDEGDLGLLPNPLLILGEPGIGKTELKQHLEQILGGKRVAAGTFSRTENLSPYNVQAGIPIIIDGLDEVAATSGESPL
jgi:hypothetical protein